MTYLAWIQERLRNIRGDYYPPERITCLLAFEVRAALMVAAALATWIWYPLVPGPAWLATSVRFVAAVAAAWLAAFAWADLGPEEWFRRRRHGHSYNPNIWPTGTLEGYCGTLWRQTAPLWEATKMLALRRIACAVVLPPEARRLEASWDGDPPGGRFGGE